MYRQWIGFVVDALNCYDREKKRWVFLPGSGGYYDQDDIIFNIWEVVIQEYYHTLEDSSYMTALENKGR